MKILVISHLFPTAHQIYNGIFVEQQVRELKKMGLEITVISPVSWAPFPLPYLKEKWKGYAKAPKFIEDNDFKRFTPKFISFPKRFLFHYSGDFVWKSIKKQLSFLFAEKFDLIHANVALPDGYAAMKLATCFNIPYLVTIHGEDFRVTINQGKKCYNSVKMILENASKIILVSKKLDKIRQDRFPNIDDGKVVVIPNGVNEQFLDRIDIKDLKSQYQGNFVLLSVSTLLPFKGLDDNIRAFAKIKDYIPNAIYLIVGDGPYKNELEREVRSLRVERSIKFLGAKSPEDVQRYMNLCDVFSLPSWDEAFGMVYLEAMACGKPVIGCLGEGISDVVETGVTGWLVPPRDVDQLSKLFLKLYKDINQRRMIGENAKNYVGRNLTWKHNSRRVIEAYVEALNQYHDKTKVGAS